MRNHFILNRMTIRKRKRTIASVGKDVGKLEPSHIAGRNVRYGAVTLEDNPAGPQQVKYRLII